MTRTSTLHRLVKEPRPCTSRGLPPRVKHGSLSLKRRTPSFTVSFHHLGTLAIADLVRGLCFFVRGRGMRGNCEITRPFLIASTNPNRVSEGGSHWVKSKPFPVFPTQFFRVFSAVSSFIPSKVCAPGSQPQPNSLTPPPRIFSISTSSGQRSFSKPTRTGFLAVPLTLSMAAGAAIGMPQSMGCTGATRIRFCVPSRSKESAFWLFATHGASQNGRGPGLTGPSNGRPSGSRYFLNLATHSETMASL